MAKLFRSHLKNVILSGAKDLLHGKYETLTCNGIFEIGSSYVESLQGWMVESMLSESFSGDA